MAQENSRKPRWLTRRLPDPAAMARIRGLLNELKLHTICESALCPNIGECWSQGTATFMILGDICTRRCGFCDVTTARPGPVDDEEPGRVAEAIARLGLRHAVITTVARDDLPDGGAAHFAATIEAVRRRSPETAVEALISDFDGRRDCLETVLEAGPEILAHNVETVPRLHRKVRPRFRFERSLEVLAMAKQIRPRVFTKSNIMLGLGETEDEVVEVMKEMRAAGVDFLTIGQYLRPSKRHLPVVEYVHPSVFERLREKAESLGFAHVASGPFVRSSYQAHESLDAVGSGVRRGSEADHARPVHEL